MRKGSIPTEGVDDMHFGFGGFGMILFWIAFVAVILILIRVFVNGTSGRKEYRSKTPLDILKERYAAGEISRDQFEEKKRDLAEH
jgi:putative membrane protein